MQGMTPEGFEAGVRTDLASRQVLNGVAGTGLASSAQAELGMDALNERREVQIARFEPAQFVAKVNLTDAEVEAYYKANLANYQAPKWPISSTWCSTSTRSRRPSPSANRT